MWIVLGTRILWYVSIALTITLLVQLYRQRLLGTYKALAAYLVWDVVTAIVLACLPYGKTIYGYFYFSFHPLTCLFYVLTALELMTQVLRHYPGFAVLGRRLISFSLAGACCLALLSMIIEPNVRPGAPRWTIIAMNLFLLGRVVCLTVLGFIGTSMVLFKWFPLPLPANATRFMVGYSLCFAARTIGYLVVTQKGFTFASEMSFSIIAVVSCSLLYWIIQLNPAGEKTNLVPNRQWTPEKHRRTLEQIESINATLVRTREK